MILKTLNARINSAEFNPIHTKHVLLFKEKSNWMTDFLILSSMCGEINKQDKINIASKLIGLRMRDDLLLLLRWMNENKEIDSHILECELDCNCE